MPNTNTIACETVTLPRPKNTLEHQSTTELAVIAMLHDIRNVLSRLECSSNLLEPMIKQTPSTPLQELWGLHRRAGLRLYEMAGRLLDTAWNSSARQKTELGPLVEGVCALCRDALHLARVELKWTVQPNCPALELHADALSRALHALIENAMDACTVAEHGCVHVGLTHEPHLGAVLLSVSDNGPGIDPALQDKIFEPRFTTKDSTGLGLSLANRIVEDHGGSIMLVSEPGLTVFKIHLPIETVRVISR